MSTGHFAAMRKRGQPSAAASRKRVADASAEEDGDEGDERPAAAADSRGGAANRKQRRKVWTCARCSQKSDQAGLGESGRGEGDRVRRALG